MIVDVKMTVEIVFVTMYAGIPEMTVLIVFGQNDVVV
jgi:hypothetical protein